MSADPTEPGPSESVTPRTSPGGLFGGLDARLEAAAEAETDKPTMNMMALVELPAEQRSLVRHLLRAGGRPTLAECADTLGVPVDELRVTVGKLVMIGLVESHEDRLRAIPGWRASRLPPGGVWSSLSGL
jgi:hypothetical protein